MTPQVGDIWEYAQPNYDSGKLTVLIHEHRGSFISRFSGSVENIYYGYDMLTDEYDEFTFNDENKLYWRKVA